MSDDSGDFDPAARVDQLRHEIEQHNDNYYVRDAPTISDAEYDALMRELRELEERYPELRDEASPTQRVGGAVGKGFRPVRHPRPMLSLGNAFSHEQLDAWYQRVRNILPNARFKFVVEPKIDGLAIALLYVKGEFRQGATRGNGIEGEDVTANLRTVEEVPKQLADSAIPERVEVRGEIYMSIAGFEQLNERRVADGAALFANPRSSAAGSLRQLDAEITRGRPLQLWAYAIGYMDGGHVESQWETLKRLGEWGFPVNTLARHLDDFAAVHDYVDWMQGERERLPYEIDGVVVKIDSVHQQEELGHVGREPRWAIAYKYPPRQATTRLRAIEVNIGRTGTVNPYAVLEPVTVGGVVVHTATLHNEEDIQRKDIRVGDRVIVHRAGDVIPQVVKPVVEERTGAEAVYHLPDRCPFCGTPIIRPEGEAMARCPNPNCPQQRLRWLEHFVSEPTMDIRGLGIRQLKVLLDRGLIQGPADLYGLTREQLVTLPGIQEKSASNLLTAIERSKRRPLANVINALGIRYVGMQTAELLAQALLDLDRLAAATQEELEGIDGIGGKTAASIAEWMDDSENREFLRRLKAAGVTWRQAATAPATGPLAGKAFLLTGRLDSMPRGQAESRLQELGATIAPSINKSVDYLIVGAEPGSKLAKARKLGTAIRDEEWLLRVLETRSIPPE